MANCSVLFLLFVFGVFRKGLTALIQTQQTVMAAVGDEALLSCQLTEVKDVLQVTWQKSEEEKNVATYSKQFGERVNVDFRDKVKFKDAGLQSSSIIIRDVTEKDEGCYKCLFNTYPEGALIRTTCLKLYELHEPVLHVTESNSPEETVVSCSVTGRPAPTVTLRVLKDNVHLSNFSSVSVTNTNSTVTVTTTAVLPCFHDNSTQVGCAVRVLSGPQTERFMMIPEVKQTSADVFHENSWSDSSDFNVYWIIVCVSVVAFCCIAPIIIIQKRRNRDSEKIKTPQKTIELTEIKAPLLQHESEPLRRRMSTGKNKKRDDPKASPPTGSVSQRDSEKNKTTQKTIEQTEIKTPLFQHESDEPLRLRMSPGKNKKRDDPKASSPTGRSHRQLIYQSPQRSVPE